MVLGPLKTVAELLTWQPPAGPAVRYTPPPIQPEEPAGRPKLLVCHDYQGGYVEDSWPKRCGGNMAAAYRLSYWRHVDVFVYFSHHLVTIPPVGWTEAAHLHGVKVLGTFITEWNAGKDVCCQLLESEAAAEQCARQLAAIAAYHGFEGWLINIETELPLYVIPNMLTFLRHLTELLHEQHPSKLCIWYDAVTTEGKLEWQDTLNVLNEPFFEATDGLFVNYCWKEETPSQIAAAAGSRCSEVYLGVDVFGRNTFGGGGMASGDAVRAAQSAGVSAALFAPGWVSEVGDPTTFEERQEQFWRGIAAGVCHPRPLPHTSSFVSTFSQGCGNFFKQGHRVSSESWYDVGLMSTQPLFQRTEVEDGHGRLDAQVTMSTAFQGGSCLQLTGAVKPGSALHLWLFDVAVHPPAGRDLAVCYTAACASPTCISLVLYFEPLDPGSGSAPTTCMLAPDPGVVDAQGHEAQLPVDVCQHSFDGDDFERLSACGGWISRHYLLPQQLLHSHFIGGIGILCQAVPGAACNDTHAELHAYLGMIAIGEGVPHDEWGI